MGIALADFQTLGKYLSSIKVLSPHQENILSGYLMNQKFVNILKRLATFIYSTYLTIP